MARATSRSRPRRPAARQSCKTGISQLGTGRRLVLRGRLYEALVAWEELQHLAHGRHHAGLAGAAGGVFGAGRRRVAFQDLRGADARVLLLGAQALALLLPLALAFLA